MKNEVDENVHLDTKILCANFGFEKASSLGVGAQTDRHIQIDRYTQVYTNRHTQTDKQKDKTKSNTSPQDPPLAKKGSARIIPRLVPNTSKIWI